MDSFEWNKIFGAVLGTALFVVALGIVVDGVMAPEKSDKPGMDVVVKDDPGTDGGAAPVAELKPDWGSVIPAADLVAGEKLHTRCFQCHDFAKGGPDKIGPNLYGIVGASHARQPNYAYSPALRALAAKAWGYEELNELVKNPKTAVPGTKMAFPGLSKVQDRINLIAYLRTLSDAPLAVPAPNPAAPPPAAPADGSEPPAGELQVPPPGIAIDGLAHDAPAIEAPPAPAPVPPAPTPPTGGGGH